MSLSTREWLLNRKGNLVFDGSIEVRDVCILVSALIDALSRQPDFSVFARYDCRGEEIWLVALENPEMPLGLGTRVPFSRFNAVPKGVTKKLMQQLDSVHIRMKPRPPTDVYFQAQRAALCSEVLELFRIVSELLRDNGVMLTFDGFPVQSVQWATATRPPIQNIVLRDYRDVVEEDGGLRIKDDYTLLNTNGNAHVVLRVQSSMYTSTFDLTASQFGVASLHSDCACPFVERRMSKDELCRTGALDEAFGNTHRLSAVLGSAYSVDISRFIAEICEMLGLAMPSQVPVHSAFASSVSEMKLRGNSSFKKHRYSEAIEAYQCGLKIHAQHSYLYWDVELIAALHRNLGQSFLKLGGEENVQRAMQCANSAFVFEPASVKTAFIKAKAAFALKEYRTAWECILVARELLKHIRDPDIERLARELDAVACEQDFGIAPMCKWRMYVGGLYSIA